ncbi:hypothetical protein ABZN45_05475 [Campylobacter sp. MRC_CM3]|uniref:hypothetical protein n=1 Tax=Campylobacter molothri TaxID=1032242 RepID=UPI0035B2CDCC
MKADQAKFKSSYIYLNQYIKEAKDSYYFFKEFNFSNKVLKVVDDNKQLFLKEFPKIKNLLNIHKDYQPIIDNIFHNFDYVIKKINLIEEWLLSNDFNEKYKKENHPYPSLLDPKKLNDEKEEINYKTIPAELAWEMNLPLPDNYEFMLISGHANAAGPFMSCLYICNINIVWAGLVQGVQRYIFYFNFLINNINHYNALHWGEIIKNFPDNYKLAALVAKDCYYLIFLGTQFRYLPHVLDMIYIKSRMIV